MSLVVVNTCRYLDYCIHRLGLVNLCD
jgi:hypothetical protein